MKSMKIGFLDYYNRIKKSPYLSWLKFILFGFIVIWIVDVNAFGLIVILNKPDWCAFTSSIYALAVFLFVNAIMFFLLLKPDVYYLIEKYKNTKVNELDKQEFLIKLNCHMETNKPYLNPDITLEILAAELSINPRILSQIINETYNKNFKSFILDYRIKESMKILEDPKQKNLTILEILYEVGFNSKSAFNYQFKLITNLTPLEYRSKYAC